MNTTSKPCFVMIVRALALALAVALTPGCNRNREQLPAEAGTSAENAQAVKVTVAPVTHRSVQRMVGVVGTLHGYEEISLGAKVEGRVRKISHDVADRVKPGETLLEIDPTDYQLNVRQAQRALQVELAKLGLSETPSGTVDVTRIPTVVQAQLRRDNAQKRMERAKTLVERKASAEEDLTEKMSDFRVAQAEYDNQVLVAKTGIAAIQVKQEALAIAGSNCKTPLVRVPEPSQKVPGVEKGATYAITSRTVAEGSYVKAGADVFKIVIESPLKFRGRVPERKSGEVRLGQKAEVYTCRLSASVSGRGDAHQSGGRPANANVRGRDSGAQRAQRTQARRIRQDGDSDRGRRAVRHRAARGAGARGRRDEDLSGRGRPCQGSASDARRAGHRLGRNRDVRRCRRAPRSSPAARPRSPTARPWPCVWRQRTTSQPEAADAEHRRMRRDVPAAPMARRETLP